MKIIALGDLHGRTDWKDIMTKESDADLYVLIGDYFDTHENISAARQISNFKDIIAYKKANMEKVILLFGNHDEHYLRTSREKYSGYQPLHKIDIQEVLHSAIDDNLMQMCYISGNILFVHAGVSKTWCKEHDIDMKNIEQSINDLFKHKPNSFGFIMGDNCDMYGDDICQSPTWIRPQSLLKDKIDGYIQVVGHTTMQKIKPINDVYVIDTLGTSGEYLKIIDGVISVVK